MNELDLENVKHKHTEKTEYENTLVMPIEHLGIKPKNDAVYRALVHG